MQSDVDTSTSCISSSSCEVIAHSVLFSVTYHNCEGRIFLLSDKLNATVEAFGDDAFRSQCKVAIHRGNLETTVCCVLKQQE